MSLIIAIALSSAPALATDPRCGNGKILRADAEAKPGIHTLDKEPPARHILGVVREIDGCNIPVSVREPVGQPLRRQESRQ